MQAVEKKETVFNFVDNKNDKFDIHRFLNNVLISPIGEIPKEVQTFIHSLYPDDYLGSDTEIVQKSMLKSCADFSILPSPRDILCDPWFEEFYHKNSAHVIESYTYP